MNILRNVCLKKSYLYINVFFTYFYSIIFVKLICVYCAYSLCFPITILFLCVCLLYIYFVCFLLHKLFHNDYTLIL